MNIRLHYDGNYSWIAPPDDRQWTVVNHWRDADGQDRFQGSFSQRGLIEIGAIPAQKFTEI